VAKYINAGFRTVQLRWDSDWEYTGSSYTKNIKYAACRVATAAKNVYNWFHPEAANKGFCYHGQSGGSGAGGYLLAWYGLENKMDAVMMTTGPVFGNISAGCTVPPAPQVTVCPTGQYGCSQQSLSYSDYPAYRSCSRTTDSSELGKWTGYDCNCVADGPTSAAANAAWADMSVVSSGADFAYPHTAVSNWYCVPPGPHNMSPVQGQFFASQMTSTNVPFYLEALVINCDGDEGVWTGDYQVPNDGLDASAGWMTTNCALHP
jgi:hypothetical protein